MTKRYLVRGQVQGVGYRWFVRTEAIRLGLVGYAANLPDGRVEVMAAGAETALEALEQALGRGPRAALVAGVSADTVESSESYTTFSIR